LQAARPAGAQAALTVNLVRVHRAVHFASHSCWLVLLPAVWC
jgi:hypothetical protein